MTKTCTVCKQKLSLDNFYVNKRYKDGRRKECKSCGYKLYKTWRMSPETSERINAKNRAKYDPVKKKSQHLKYLYGITLEEYNQKLERQGGGCAICGVKIPGGNGKHFYVDHNHTTRQVRDLLCHNCNYVIGYAKEDVDILKAVIQYLETWRES